MSSADLSIRLTSLGDDILAQTVALVWQAMKLDEGKAGITHYAIREAREGEHAESGGWLYGRHPRPLRLIFFQGYSLPSDAVKLPFRLDAGGAADFARRWLAEADYDEEPDTDGSVEKGFTVYNEQYGHIDGDWSAAIAISPEWIVYGK